MSVKGFNVVISQHGQEVPAQYDGAERHARLDPARPITVRLLNYCGIDAPAIVKLNDEIVCECVVPANDRRRFRLVLDEGSLTRGDDVIPLGELNVLFHNSLSSAWRCMLWARQPKVESCSRPTKSSDDRLAYRNVPAYVGH